MTLLKFFGIDEQEIKEKTKKCSCCKIEKSLNEFASWRKGDSKHKRTRCKICESKSDNSLKQSKKLAGNPLAPPIGTPCPICGNTKHKLCFDHDHHTKKHRGWLCPQCNRAIGQLGDNISGLMRAVKYLEQHETNVS
jgi:hypothetical protein